MGFGEYRSGTLSTYSRTLFTRKSKKGFVCEHFVNEGLVLEQFAKLFFLTYKILRFVLSYFALISTQKLTRGLRTYNTRRLKF